MYRKFKEGEKKRFGDMFLNIEKGSKTDNDLVLMCRTNGKVKVTMASILYMLDFFFDNEDVLYPRSKGYKGRYKLKDSIEETFVWGWVYAVKKINKEKEAKRNRTPVV